RRRRPGRRAERRQSRGHRAVRLRDGARRDDEVRRAHAGSARRVVCGAGSQRAPVGVPALTLLDRDRAVVWHPYTQMKTAAPPLPIVRGQGVYLYTEDGRRLLDGISSWWVNIHGHSHPRLNQAIAAQAAQLEHVIFAGATHEPAVELAERLIDVLPAGLTRVF